VLREPGRIADPMRAFFRVRERCQKEHDVRWLGPFGLNNTYVLAMQAQRAKELGVQCISDLVKVQARLRAGFSVEFGQRADGLLGLRKTYGLEFGSTRTVEHSLAYDAIRSGAIDVMDAYSTDGKLLKLGMRLLEDDRGFFPPYHAAPVVRGAVLRDHPELGKALAELAFRVPDRVAQALNYVVEAGYRPGLVVRAWLEREGLVEGVDAEAQAAGEALAALLDRDGAAAAIVAPDSGVWSRRAKRAARLLFEHVAMTGIAVLLAALLAIPLGIFITERPTLRRLALGTAGVLQTIPGLALLAFMIPLLGLDVKAAVAALLLYAILPILRNTYTGIAGVDPDLVDAARGIGMRPAEVLRWVQLPLAMRTIMAGIRTAAVISIGVATLAAFIGAGGFGELIVEGLYLNDSGLILSGALPAALLAIVTDMVLGRAEIALQPRIRAQAV
ncbi:MAG: ABC transporter permease subunit, partial [Planctomycetes bacterium]|nr:ABC transporter permease subunit [Planctomycetota bacterium]